MRRRTQADSQQIHKALGQIQRKWVPKQVLQDPSEVSRATTVDAEEPEGEETAGNSHPHVVSSNIHR